MLFRSGFIETVMGKGSFVSGRNKEVIREENLRIVEEYLEMALDTAKKSGICFEEVIEILQAIHQEEEGQNS